MFHTSCWGRICSILTESLNLHCSPLEIIFKWPHYQGWNSSLKEKIIYKARENKCKSFFSFILKKLKSVWHLCVYKLFPGLLNHGVDDITGRLARPVLFIWKDQTLPILGGWKQTRLTFPWVESHEPLTDKKSCMFFFYWTSIERV